MHVPAVVASAVARASASDGARGVLALPEPSLECFGDAVASVAKEVLVGLQSMAASVAAGAASAAPPPPPSVDLLPQMANLAPEMAAWSAVETGLGAQELIKAMVLTHNLRPRALDRVVVGPSAHRLRPNLPPYSSG